VCDHSGAKKRPKGNPDAPALWAPSAEEERSRATMHEGDRAEPLRPATMARIAKGLEKFGPEAFYVKNYGVAAEAAYRAKSMGEPLGDRHRPRRQPLRDRPCRR
jgi:hypothetical protein